MRIKGLLATIAEIAVFAVLLFGAAGTIAWPGAWTFLAILFGFSVAIIGSFSLCYRVFWENTYLAPVVRIQRERGHHVVASGPYGIVRHPLYASVMIFFPGVTLLLGSWYGLIVAAMIMALLVVRTSLEDRMLQRELEGYADYAAKVRYRLMPGLW